MKLDILESHDRKKDFVKKNASVSECCQDLIDQKPFDNYAFYIFAHSRTDEDGHSKRLIWQPRLTRPKPQTNSMLFKACPKTSEIRICWVIPPREMFDCYKSGNVTEDEITDWSINMFEKHREVLEKPEPDDLSDEEIDGIYRELSQKSKYDKFRKSLRI